MKIIPEIPSRPRSAGDLPASLPARHRQQRPGSKIQECEKVLDEIRRASKRCHDAGRVTAVLLESLDRLEATDGDQRSAAPRIAGASPTQVVLRSTATTSTKASFVRLCDQLSRSIAENRKICREVRGICSRAIRCIVVPEEHEGQNRMQRTLHRGSLPAFGKFGLPPQILEKAAPEQRRASGSPRPPRIPSPTSSAVRQYSR